MAGKAGPEGSWVYEWTCDNKMERAEKDGALEAEYAYDYRGERIRKTTPGESVNYLVDNNNRTGYSQVARETNASGAELAAYSFGDDLISQTRAGAVSFFHYDGLGSTRALTSIAGDVTDAVTYLAFGQILARTGTTEFSHLFTGEAYDFNIGYYYLRARLYDPVNGMFASLDPFYGVYYMSSSLHKYSYVNNNPILFTDLSGYFNLIKLAVILIVLTILVLLALPCAKSWQDTRKYNITARPLYKATGGASAIALRNPDIIKIEAEYTAERFCLIGYHRENISAYNIKERYMDYTRDMHDNYGSQLGDEISIQDACIATCYKYCYGPLVEDLSLTEGWGVTLPDNEKVHFLNNEKPDKIGTLEVNKKDGNTEFKSIDNWNRLYLDKTGEDW